MPRHTRKPRTTPYSAQLRARRTVERTRARLRPAPPPEAVVIRASERGEYLARHDFTPDVAPVVLWPPPPADAPRFLGMLGPTAVYVAE